MLKWLPLMIAAAAGVLVGEAAFHIVPDAIGKGLWWPTVCALVLSGMAVSFGIESACHYFLARSEVAPVGRISLLAESVHNLIDGAIIATAYFAGWRVGLLATFAIAVHELPHELGNFAVLVHAGYSRKRAIFLNLLSATSAFGGALAVILLGAAFARDSDYALPIAAGTFLYVSVVDLLPALWKGSTGSTRTSIGFVMTAGASFMFVLTFAH